MCLSPWVGYQVGKPSLISHLEQEEELRTEERELHQATSPGEHQADTTRKTRVLLGTCFIHWGDGGRSIRKCHPGKFENAPSPFSHKSFALTVLSCVVYVSSFIFFICLRIHLPTYLVLRCNWHDTMLVLSIRHNGKKKVYDIMVQCLNHYVITMFNVDHHV